VGGLCKHGTSNSKVPPPIEDDFNVGLGAHTC
jgi:hypothetical protein